MNKAKHVLATVCSDNCIVEEFDDFSAYVLSLAEEIKLLTVSREDSIAMEDEVAKSVVDELKTQVGKFQDDVSNMVAHICKCRYEIFSSRDKVLGLKVFFIICIPINI